MANRISELKSKTSLIFVALMATVFVFFLSNGYGKAGTDKGILYIIIAGSYCFLEVIYKIISLILGQNKENRVKADVSGWFLFAYAFTLFLSFVFSVNKQEALWGTDGWYQGFVPLILMVISALFISESLSMIDAAILLLMSGSAIQYVLIIINRFGIYPLKFDGIGLSFIGTLGNVNWFCGYWSVLFAFSVGLVYTDYFRTGIKKVLISMCVAVGAIAGVIQGSDSALLVFAALGLSLVIFTMKNTERIDRLCYTLILIFAPLAIMSVILWIADYTIKYDATVIKIMWYTPCSLIIGLIIAAFMFINRKITFNMKTKVFYVVSYTVIVVSLIFVCFFFSALILNTISYGSIGVLSDNPLLYMDYHWGNGRGATLYAGATLFRNAGGLQKLFGVGPDCFSYALYQGGNEAAFLVNDIFKGSRLTNAHNEFLTVLVNMGIAGAVSYFGLLLSSLRKHLKKGDGINLGCALALIGYMVNNLVSFAQPVNITFLFLLLGLGAGNKVKEK